MSITIHVTGTLNEGYQIGYRLGAPGETSKTTKDAKKIPAALFQPGAILDPVAVSTRLGEKDHSLLEIQKMGDDIAVTFFSGKTGAFLRQEQDRVVAEHSQWRAAGSTPPEPMLRTYLRIDPPELQVLPWECCRVANEGLFFHRALPLIRTGAAKLTKRPDLNEWPIRVIAVIGTQAVQALEEVRELRRVLRQHDHSFDLEIFDCAVEKERPGNENLTLVQLLKDRIAGFKPHILHFAGHAWYTPARLQLRASDNDEEEWTAVEIGDFLGGQTWSLRLAFLNACRTQKPAAETDSFTRAFTVRGGASATIAMCGDIRGVDAGICAGLIYGALATGTPVDQAVSIARANLGSNTKAAYYPTFTSLALPEPIVSAGSFLDRQRMDQLEQFAQLQPVKQFVDRTEPRRKLFASILSGIRAIAVSGDHDNGKTWFLTSASRCLAWQGYSVVYVNLTRHTTWNTVLWSILEGGDEPELSPSLSKETRKAMEKVIGTLAAPIELTQSGLLPSAIERAMEAMRPPVQDKPLVLVLDHLEPSAVRAAISAEIANVINYFYNPIARGDGRIRLILSCGNETAVREQKPAGSWSPIDLQPFPARDVKELMRDWFMARDPKLLAQAEEYLLFPVKKAKTPREFAASCESIWKDLV